MSHISDKNDIKKGNKEERTEYKEVILSVCGTESSRKAAQQR